MQQQMIEQQVLALLFSELQTEVVSADTDLLETGLLDSLKLVSLLAIIESRFGLQIMDGDLDLENFRSVVRIAEFLRSRQPVGNGHEREFTPSSQ